MKFEEWEPIYREICDFFSFSAEEDDNASHILVETAKKNQSIRDGMVELQNLYRIKGLHVTVFGNAPSLKDDLKKRNYSGILIAADAAAGVLIETGLTPDIIVTDLDGIDDYAILKNIEGTILVVHAHGDNIPQIKTWVSKFSGPVILTTQNKPFTDEISIYNFGGFTDGDRAVFFALSTGARSVDLAGFDLDDTDVTPIKRGKLIFARRLLKLAGIEI